MNIREMNDHCAASVTAMKRAGSMPAIYDDRKTRASLLAGFTIMAISAAITMSAIACLVSSLLER